MELHEFHVHKFRARLISKGHTIAGVLPGVGSDAPCFANTACGDDDRLRFEYDEAAALAPIRKRPGNAAAIHQESRDRAFHVGINSLLDAAILQRTNHFEAGAVAYVTEALEGVAAKGALKNVAAFGAVEQGAPLFEFANAIGGLLSMKLGHAPVVQKFSAAHRVAKMRFPTVGSIHVGHCCGYSALGHYGVSFSEKRFADHAHGGALRERFDGGTQSGAAGADDENVVFAGLVVCRHRSLRSRKVPQATMRT